ncbi:MAG: tryptophan 7-halogenase [Chloroflexi bacterium]|nr:tryptophan 7-halogenase [Chloroflexota bacterium]MCI0574997.1 tryptophan 7-halogenase [Chloroflexota bacterium]MCI0645775.1 tryptophan 7-halogenase [Chloroflexota bacterium]MCI0727702.1 tryptophan 7-halogenase [Chloroflexota bacterium]
MNDVIIIGGGPAGSTLGSYLSKAGFKNTIFEATNHPRSHVGESMVMSSVRVFEEIGFLPVMEREGFIRKYGASWHPMTAKGEAAICFNEFPQAGITQDYTYHVDRSKLDLLMLKHAESLGTKVYQGVTVTRVLFDDNDYACGVRIRIADQEIDVPARLVVDASGRQTLLGRQLKVKKNDPIFDQFAVHAWFENVAKGNSPSANFIHVYFLPVQRGWAWQIPITEEITSMGIVAEREVFRQAHLEPADYFFKFINSNPDLAAAMQNARRINDFKLEGDYSYKMDTFAGNGFVMIGDAARFVDPIFSSGVSVALYSAKYSFERIQYAFETGDFSEAALKPYEHKLRAGTEIWYEFIRLYYKLLPLFTYFISSKQHRLEVLRLLQGEVFDRSEVPVLDEMRKYIRTVEASDNHVFKGQLSDIPID